ncbi:MAG: zinc metallopeptidase [Clostridia bacterium]|nr:zinc metallopeptidase [Clostridia bacterium]
MFFFDPTYIVILPALIFSIWASMRVSSTFKQYSKVYTRRGYTAAMACRAVLDSNGLYHVRIEHIQGNLTDHYDPREDVIRLSDSVYNSTSAAAIGVACHEAGHAIQHAERYLPIRIRQAIIPLTNIGSRFGIWIFIIGIILTAWSQQMVLVAYIGLALFSLTAVFQLVTLPTEYNASRRAVNAIVQTGILDKDELECAKKVLSAAALTYVAALAASLTQLLRLFLILGNSKRR